MPTEVVAQIASPFGRHYQRDFFNSCNNQGVELVEALCLAKDLNDVATSSLEGVDGAKN